MKSQISRAERDGGNQASEYFTVEGYKEQRGDKVVLVRNTEDWEALQKLSGIQLVVGCPEIILAVDKLRQEQLLSSWITGSLNG